jgi:predicted pyridoxine 5'-phosphate oxidase superfamily flavin-nucleotide-binding protein
MDNGFFYDETHKCDVYTFAGDFSAHSIAHGLLSLGVNKLIVYPTTPSIGQVTLVVDPEHLAQAIEYMENNRPITAQVIVESMEPGKLYELYGNKYVKWVPSKCGKQKLDESNI